MSRVQESGPGAPGKSETGGPFSSAVIDPENADAPGRDPINEQVWCPANNPFTGYRNAPDASTARKAGEQFGFFINALSDGVSGLLTIVRDVGRNFVQVAQGSLAPDQSQAVAFNFRALPIAR